MHFFIETKWDGNKFWTKQSMYCLIVFMCTIKIKTYVLSKWMFIYIYISVLSFSTQRFFLCGKLDKSFRLLTLGNSSVKLKIDCRKINWIERKARLNRSGHDSTKKKIKSWFVIAVNPVKESNVHCMLNFVTSPQFWLSILLFNFFYLDKWYYRIAIESVHVG